MKKFKIMLPNYSFNLIQTNNQEQRFLQEFVFHIFAEHCVSTKFTFFKQRKRDSLRNEFRERKCEEINNSIHKTYI